MSRIRKAGNYEIKHSMHIGNTEVVIGVDMKAPDKMYYMVADYENNGIIASYHNVLVSDDYIEIAGIYADRISAEIERLKTNEKDAPKSIITSDMCDTITDRDLENEIIVMMPQVLRPEYRTQTHQIMLCTGGHGARPDTLGVKVYGEKLYSGKHTQIERVDVLGILKKEHYPEWLKAKLEYKEALKNPDVFEYGGLHFAPVGLISQSLKFETISKNCETDTTIKAWCNEYESIKGKPNIDYRYEAFYEAASKNDADIFKCIENGKFYLPADNELFIYNGRFNKYRPFEVEKEKKTTPVKKRKNKEVER